MMSEGVFEIAGTKFVYERNYREPERLTAEGPTTQDIVLEVSIKTHYFIKDCSCPVNIGPIKADISNYKNPCVVMGNLS